MGTLLNPNIGIRWKLQCGVDPLSVGPIPCIKQAGDQEKLCHLVSKQNSNPRLCLKLWSGFSSLLFNPPTAVQINSQADTWLLVERYPGWGQVQINQPCVQSMCPASTPCLELSSWVPAWWPWDISWTCLASEPQEHNPRIQTLWFFPRWWPASNWEDLYDDGVSLQSLQMPQRFSNRSHLWRSKAVYVFQSYFTLSSTERR